MIMIPAQLAGQIMMGIYLWKAGYISKKKATWLPVSMPFLICSGLAILEGSGPDLYERRRTEARKSEWL